MRLRRHLAAAEDAPQSPPDAEFEGEHAPAESFAAGAAVFQIVRTLLKWVERYERQLSGAGMVGGFAFDNWNFRRIDMPNTQAVFAGYLSLAAISILLLHAMAEREAHGRRMPRWHAFLPMVAQFALGALWSAFLVFYSRGAVLGASWPFMLVLLAIFVANEVFKKYHSRLIFTAVLFFFALFSYAIVTTPILTHAVGTFTFMLSGAIALFVFAMFLRLVRRLGPAQWQGARWWVAAGSLAVYLTLNAFYFANILPPVPLALADGGVYRHVARHGGVYQAAEEPQTWLTLFGVPPTLHVPPGGALYAYSAVFAPIRMSVNVVHRWERYDPAAKRWRTVSRVFFAINGGRDGGYRTYSLLRDVSPGDWRVDIDTADGHIIGRLRFAVVPGKSALADEARTLK
ncbi:MAG TPA: DUF2914 domain-containing protein [Rhizomicrobium sp.]|nr:DUF2914 domain-containing protein [Rhizomicrobium sp.]